MMIVLNEIKKIFNLKMVFLLILISIIMYFLFISFYIECFPNGRPAADIYNIFVEMTANYGEYMDVEEFEHFKTLYKGKIKEADKYISSREDFRGVGITTYEEFKNMDINKKEFEQLRYDVIFDKQVDIFWELPWREEYIYTYENRKELMRNKCRYLNENQKLRIEEILKKGHEASVLPDVVFENYNDLIKLVSTLILLSIMFMISPIYLRDSKNNVNYLQYSSKLGRKIFKKKMVAGLLSAFIITTIQLILFFGLYSFNKVSMFFNSNINSIFNTIISWYDMTFIQYIVLSVIAIYILAFVVTLISIYISSIGQNYITVIGIQLPIALFTFKVLLKYLIIDMTAIWFSPFLLPLSYLILIAIGVMIIKMRWKRERGLDIV